MCASLYWPRIFQWFQDEKRGSGRARNQWRSRARLGQTSSTKKHEEKGRSKLNGSLFASYLILCMRSQAGPSNTSFGLTAIKRSNVAEEYSVVYAWK